MSHLAKKNLEYCKQCKTWQHKFINGDCPKCRNIPAWKVLNHEGGEDVPLGENQLKIVDALKMENGLITTMIATRTGLSTTQISAACKRLVERGLITGSKWGGWYLCR